MAPDPHGKRPPGKGRAPRPEPLRREGGLGDRLDATIDAWVESTRARHVPPLTTRELHAGVRAVSAHYVHGRVEGRAAAKARRRFEGAGNRAAFACYYAPLHFLTAWHALQAGFGDGLAGVERVVDFGCGSAPLAAAAAAAVACAAPQPPTLVGLEPQGWALAEARHTLRAFDLDGRLERGRLPGGLPAGAPGTLWGFGWVVNELTDRERETLLEAIEAGLRRGVGLLLLEPLAGRVSPWWDAWVHALAPHGVVADELRVRPRLPARIAEIDRATGLRHAEIGARLLHGPHR